MTPPAEVTDCPRCPLRFHLFGQFRVAGQDGGEPVRRPPRRVQEVLCYLLLVAPKPHHREQVADVLWGESDSLNARKHLRQAVWHLQSELSALAGPKAEPVLRVDNDWLQVEPNAGVWSDARELREVHERVRHRSAHELGPADVDAARAAIALYEGELLEGWYQDWCIHERERYRAMRLSLLEKLLSHAEVSRSWDEALSYGETILEEDRAHERTHLRLMRVHAARGDRTAAIRQFAVCRDALRQEFAVLPGPEVVAVYEQAREGRPLAIAEPRPRPELLPLPTVPPRVPVAPDEAAADDLEQLQASLERAAELLSRHLRNRR